MRRAPLVLTPLLAVALASPAAAAEVEVGVLEPEGAQPTWDKPTVAVEVGDTVRWSFDGTKQAHNVQSDDAEDDWPAPFASLVGVPAPPETSDPFTTVGRYRFLCAIHPESMSGVVVVGAAPPPPPPPLSEQPYPNDSGDLAVLETGEFDGEKPTLSAVKARRAGKGAKLTFRVSERSRVVARFIRGGKVRKRARVTADGKGTIRVRKGLRAGRYRIALRAEDLAGNTSPKRVRSLSIR